MQRTVQKMFGPIPSTYDTVVKLFTLFQDIKWKQEVVQRVQGEQSDVLDLACGTGILTRALAKKVHAITGIDLTREMVEEARRRKNPINVDFQHLDAEEIDNYWPHNVFDYVTAGYLLKYCNRRKTLAAIKSVLHPGGVLIAYDFTLPKNRLVRFLWRRYMALLKALSDAAIPSWRPVFRELVGIIERTDWDTSIGHDIQATGLRLVEMRYYFFGVVALIVAVKTH